MPQVFKVGSYWVYFWANENEPLEPIHVHVAQGAPNSNATKIWITKAGGCYLCNNNSQIPPRVLRNIMAVIEARSGEVIEKWTAFFGEIRYFCLTVENTPKALRQNDGRRAFLRLWAGLGRFYAPRQKAPLPRVTVYADSAGNRTKSPPESGGFL